MNVPERAKWHWLQNSRGCSSGSVLSPFGKSRLISTTAGWHWGVIKFIYYGLNFFECEYISNACRCIQTHTHTHNEIYISVKIVLNKYFDFVTINLMNHKLLIWVCMSCAWILRANLTHHSHWHSIFFKIYIVFAEEFQFHTLKKNFQLKRG